MAIFSKLRLNLFKAFACSHRTCPSGFHYFCCYSKKQCKLYAHVATVSNTDSNMLPLNKRLNEDLYLRLNSFSIPLTLWLEIRNNRRRNMSIFANDEK